LGNVVPALCPTDANVAGVELHTPATIEAGGKLTVSIGLR
jgi:hypothetical protein